MMFPGTFQKLSPSLRKHFLAIAGLCLVVAMGHVGYSAILMQGPTKLYASYLAYGLTTCTPGYIVLSIYCFLCSGICASGAAAKHRPAPRRYMVTAFKLGSVLTFLMSVCFGL